MAIDDMDLKLEQISKRYRSHWIFRKVDLHIRSGEIIAISGPNGSGKSTLLKIISGFLSPSEGKVNFTRNGSEIIDYYKYITYAAPYVDLVDQMTLKELLEFHKRFKTFKQGFTSKTIIEILQLQSAANLRINEFSSGMRQRVRIGLAILSESDLCLLDEPSTNLDEAGFLWYENLLKTYRGATSFVIASNESRDFIETTQSLDILRFKEKITA